MTSTTRPTATGNRRGASRPAVNTGGQRASLRACGKPCPRNNHAAFRKHIASIDHRAEVHFVEAGRINLDTRLSLMGGETG